MPGGEHHGNQVVPRLVEGLPSQDDAAVLEVENRLAVLVRDGQRCDLGSGADRALWTLVRPLRTASRASTSVKVALMASFQPCPAVPGQATSTSHPATRC